MPNENKIRLLIADDHKYLIDGVQLSLDESRFEVVAHTLNVHEVVPLYREHRPDVLLVDVMFNQEKTGLDILSEILEEDAEAKVVVFSQYDQDELIQKAYVLGAKAFLTKSAKVEVLIQAIERATNGDVFFTDDIAQRLAALATRSRSSTPSPKETLTPRELDIFCLLAKGLTEIEIANELGFHQRTITSNKASIKEKLKISRPAEFTIAALKDKLITLD